MLIDFYADAVERGLESLPALDYGRSKARASVGHRGLLIKTDCGRRRYAFCPLETVQVQQPPDLERAAEIILGQCPAHSALKLIRES